MTRIQCREIGNTGQDVAEAVHDGQTFSATSRHGSTMALARQLVAAGAPDQPWEVVWSDGRLRFSGPSLHRLARCTIAEPDKGRASIRPWAAFSDARFPLPGDTPDGEEAPDGRAQATEAPAALQRATGAADGGAS